MERSSPASGGTRPSCCGVSGLAWCARERAQPGHRKKVRRLGLLRDGWGGLCLPPLRKLCPNAKQASWWGNEADQERASRQAAELRTIGELRAG